MKPHDARSKHGARGAVRTHVRSAVGWLRGFPESVRADGTIQWVTLPDPRWREASRELVVDRHLIGRTVHRLHSLLRRFPRALPELVGDVAAWRAGVERRLELLKGQVHEGRALPDLAGLVRAVDLPRASSSRVLDLARSAPGLTGLLACVTWTAWADDAPLVVRLDGVERHAEAYRGVLAHAASGDPGGAAALAHRLLDLRVLGEVGVELLDLIADERLWHLPPVSREAADHLRRAFGRAPVGEDAALEVPRPEAGVLAREIVSAVAEPGRSRGVLRRRLELVELLAGPELLDERQAFWERLETLRRELSRRLGMRHQRGDEDRRVEKDLLDEVEALAATRHHRFGLTRLLAVLDAAGDEEHDLLVGVLGALPRVHQGDRLREAVVNELRWHRGALGRPAMLEALRCVRDVQREVARHPASPRRKRYLQLVSALPSTLAWEVFDESRSRDVLRRLREAAPGVLRRVETRADDEDEGVGRDWIEHLLAMVEVGVEPDRAAQVVADLPFASTEDSIPRTQLEAVARMADGDARSHERLCALFRGEAWRHELLDRLTPVVGVPGFDGVLRRLLLGASSAEVLALLRTCARLGEVDESAIRSALASFHAEPQDARPAIEILPLEAYPPALVRALEDLVRHDPDARRSAQRVLGRRFPARAAREPEMAGIRERLSEAHGVERSRLEARLQRLGAWRIDDVSPHELRRYEEKLLRRVDLARVRRLHAVVQSRLEEVLVDRLGSPRLLDELVRRGQARLVAAIAAQEPAFRDLGFSLLRRRSEGPSPWDLRDAVPNRDFCERARAQGVDLAPWLDPAPPVAVVAPDGTRLQVAIETDPLEVMRMGQPFDTCLSPGAFNFFAAIVNAADVNKQVLYARDERGAIRGRCLLTLTTDMALLTYQPYTSRSELRFDVIARDFALDLARRMGTSVALEGEVETLLAPKWYCDLPRDLAGHREQLGTLRAGLDRVEAGELASHLREALGVERLQPWVVSAVVEWSELAEQPERFLELRDLCEPEALPAATAVSAARLLRRAGDRRRARELLQPLLDRATSSRDVVPGVTIPALEGRLARELVLLGDPVHALRLLRRTREAGCRRWEDELCAERLEAAGMASEALHRRGQARALYLLATSDVRHGQKDGARRRLEALETPNP